MRRAWHPTWNEPADPTFFLLHALTLFVVISFWPIRSLTILICLPNVDEARCTCRGALMKTSTKPRLLPFLLTPELTNFNCSSQKVSNAPFWHKLP